ncbi:MAG: hypothetical protein KAJ40_06915 [Alphaproteobacteria bacterium]|nr:hypothetical protein [Alphaproteobacteria bacterium]
MMGQTNELTDGAFKNVSDGFPAVGEAGVCAGIFCRFVSGLVAGSNNDLVNVAGITTGPVID